MASSSSAPVLGVAVRGQCALRGCTKDVHVDAGTGIAHDYCGRSHAQEAQGAIRAPHGVCHTCQLPGCHESIHYEADIGRVHEYCCRSHAQEAQARGLVPPSNRQRQGQGTPHNRCSLPGCSAPRYVDPSTGSEHDFCGRTHAREATVPAALPATQQTVAPDLAPAPAPACPAPAPEPHFRPDTSQARGLLPSTAAGVAPAGVDRVWSGRAGEKAYVLSVLTNAHPKYEGVKQQFRDAWRHPSPVPAVMRVLQVRYALWLCLLWPPDTSCAILTHHGLSSAVICAPQVRNPAHVHASYTAHANHVANEQRRFHGTALEASSAAWVRSGVRSGLGLTRPRASEQLPLALWASLPESRREAAVARCCLLEVAVVARPSDHPSSRLTVTSHRHVSSSRLIVTSHRHVSSSRLIVASHSYVSERKQHCADNTNDGYKDG